MSSKKEHVFNQNDKLKIGIIHVNRTLGENVIDSLDHAHIATKVIIKYSVEISTSIV